MYQNNKMRVCIVRKHECDFGEMINKVEEINGDCLKQRNKKDDETRWHIYIFPLDSGLYI